MADGIIIIDKPQDWTSMDVCAKLRGIFHERRIGHAGTLDPMATGVLPVFVGRATRAVEFASESEKEYVAGLRLGVETNTQDTTGTVLAKRPVSVSQAELEQVLGQFRGEILQIPPMYSAIKVGGKKLYELARKGREVERQPRAVTIHSLTLEEQTGPADYTLRVRCSKGTYVRTLCHDIGRALGCGGCMSGLRRTMAAGFKLEDALPLEQVLQAEGPASLLLGVDNGLLLHDGAGAGLDDGDRNDLAVGVEQLGHAQLLADDTFLHCVCPPVKVIGWWFPINMTSPLFALQRDGALPCLSITRRPFTDHGRAYRPL